MPVNSFQGYFHLFYLNWYFEKKKYVYSSMIQWCYLQSKWNVKILSEYSIFLTLSFSKAASLFSVTLYQDINNLLCILKSKYSAALH